MIATPSSTFPSVPGYAIEGELGRGGMGVVYRARQTELNRPVAIKMILGGRYTDPMAQARFLVEAEVIAAVQHPHVVQVYEFGRCDEQPFFVLEYVEGGSLAGKLREVGRFAPREAAQVVAQLADGMAAAHQKGVVHRDLKPGNVLLTAAGEPKITDFGLARMGQSDMTASGAVMGTPSYMSPEQAAGKTREVGTPTDVYALGAILYELMTGRRPFTGDSVMETIQLVLHREPARPRTLEPRIPRDLETICLKCLNKDTRQRYANATELAADLRAFLEGRPIAARPIGLFERAWKWGKRNPAWSAGIAAGLLLLVVGMVAGVVIRRNVLEDQKRIQATGLVERLRDANTSDLPPILKDLESFRQWADPLLREENARAMAMSREKLHTSLALLPVDAAQVDFLYGRLLDAAPQEVAVIVDALAPHKDGLVPKLWQVVEAPAPGKEPQRLRAAAALAKFDPDSAQWAKAGGPVVGDLARENPLHLGLWTEQFRPVRLALLAALAEMYRDPLPERLAERKLATNLLADYAADQPEVLADLLLDADAGQFAALFPKFRDQGDRGLPLLTAEIGKKAQVPPERVVLETDGKVAADDPKVKVVVGKQTGNLPAQRYEVRLEAGMNYRLTLDSKEIDSFLVVQDRAGKELAFDDDGGGFPNSLLFFQAPADDAYQVFAASYKGNGTFHLKVVETIPVDFGDRKEQLAKRQANAAVALLKMNHPEKVWPLLKHSPDPRVRSYLVHRFGPLGADSQTIVERFDQEPDLTIRRALLLSLGEYDEKELPPATRLALLPKLQALYRDDPDPGLHAAAEWLLRHWGQEPWIQQVNETWAKDTKQRDQRIENIRQEIQASRERQRPVDGKRPQTVGPPVADAPGSPRWYVNGQGQTFVVIPGPVEFLMGSPPTEKDRRNDETRHRKKIGRTFALAAKAVTMEQYRKFEKGYDVGEAKYHRTAHLPAVAIDWYRAARYCNWLSEQEGIPEDQWCYEVRRTQDIVLQAGYLSLSGYRLPTEAEMEYATRAGATTARYFGETEELLPNYAGYNKNSQEQPWPVGSFKPNDFGLFDVQGNVWTWCQESYGAYTGQEDREGALRVDPTTRRALRGGSFVNRATYVRSSFRSVTVPTYRSFNNGFRPSRTLPP